ncbi:uncharacterized protein LOC130641281 isoform X2 [Hydractinia symbiolongicarpus]|uniref:uncharacterized protein LOC130641281 isoform X2 n=1 Tax=Hydractinia symbiolongicarpus TaxID=13093 RepID=UPI002549C929|nr:uncharacterized protein LOC130641281 isoform X2 [Hydractinia symbiolongicarpus]
MIIRYAGSALNTAMGFICRMLGLVGFEVGNENYTPVQQQDDDIYYQVQGELIEAIRGRQEKKMFSRIKTFGDRIREDLIKRINKEIPKTMKEYKGKTQQEKYDITDSFHEVIEKIKSKSLHAIKNEAVKKAVLEVLRSREKDEIETIILESEEQGKPIVNIEYHNEKTIPLAAAIKTKDMTIVKYLLEHGANVNQLEPKYLEPPLFLAIECGHLGILSLLIMKNADVNQRVGSELITPLHYAIMRKNIAAVGEFVDSNNLKTNLKNKAGDTPLHSAIYSDNCQMVYYISMVCRLEDFEEKNNNELTPQEINSPFSLESKKILKECKTWRKKHEDDRDDLWEDQLKVFQQNINTQLQISGASITLIIPRRAHNVFVPAAHTVVVADTIENKVINNSICGKSNNVYAIQESSQDVKSQNVISTGDTTIINMDMDSEVDNQHDQVTKRVELVKPFHNDDENGADSNGRGNPLNISEESNDQKIDTTLASTAPCSVFQVSDLDFENENPSKQQNLCDENKTESPTTSISHSNTENWWTYKNTLNQDTRLYTTSNDSVMNVNIAMLMETDNDWWKVS